MSPAQLLARWQALALRVRAALAACALGLVALAVVLALSSRDAHVSLFANPLKPDQLAEVDAQLAAWNVAFTPALDNIRVDTRNRTQLLARLAIAGVPHAHVVGTSEALASVGTLTPQAILDAQARAGLEGDLEKGLRGIGGIGDARVIIAPARTGLFADEAPSPASASVRLSAAAGQTVSPTTLAAVRAFVAAGVPGLRADHVTVVDERGAIPDERAQDAHERETALQSALDAAFGIDATIVRVQLERDDRFHDARQIKGEKKRDYAVDVREERTVVPAGTIARLSIAVIVDARRGLDLAKIREVATAAGGLDPRRGDTLSVEAVAFDRPVRRAQPFAYALGFFGEAAPVFALALVAVVALRTGAQPLMVLATEIAQHVRLRRTKATVPGLSPQAIIAALRNEPPYVAAAVIATLKTPLATAVLELYDPRVRAEIASRLARPVSPLVPDVETLLRDG